MGALKVEISPDREGVGPDSTTKLDGIMKVVVPKEQAVAAPPAGDISNPASKSANATSEDRLDMHADLIVSAYEECPEFLRPIFAKSLGINDFNKTKVRLALFFFSQSFSFDLLALTLSPMQTRPDLLIRPLLTSRG